jgi:hypothetical protein
VTDRHLLLVNEPNLNRSAADLAVRYLADRLAR